jgi:hypothetical protein
MASQRFARALLAAAAVLGASMASAQQGEEPAPAPAPPVPAPCCTVAPRTPVVIEITDTVNSRANHSRDAFAFRLAEPLMAAGRVLVPAGTPGVGEVVHAARARAMGKAGELILAARYLQLGETRIMLRSLRIGAQQGRDSSGTVTTMNVVAAGTIPALSLVAFVITGGEVNVPAGTRAQAQTAAEIVLAPVE